MNLTDQEAFAFLETLFPKGLKDRALIAELCPEGWEMSPLFACYHPAPEVRYEEHLAFSRNLKNLFAGRKRKSGEPGAEIPPDEPEPTFEEFLAKNPPKDPPVTAEASIDEPGELLGLCLWDVFSDNHEVIASDGRTVDLGSFRGSAGTIADFMDSFPSPGDGADDRRFSRGHDYMDFYMGTWWIGRRADLTPVYGFIFARLKAMGADWRYSFPRLHIIDFSTRAEDPKTPYDPSSAFQREAENKAKAEELAKMRRRLDLDAKAAKREARVGKPPATVQAYQGIYGKFPYGWPPDPYA